jgi:acyl carrier protein
VDTTERIRGFIREELGFSGPPAELDEDRHLIDAGILDSLGIFRLVGFLEDDMGIVVEDDELLPENFASIRAITSFIAAKHHQEA